MKQVLFSAILLFVSSLVYAQYSVVTIPEVLTKDANAVKRLEDFKIEIYSPKKLKIKQRTVITILNEAGDGSASFYARYDRFTNIVDISGTLYDAMGNKLKTVRKKDIVDVTQNDGSNLAMDNRLKMHSFYHRNYPYTVEYEYEKIVDGYFSLPRWYPVDNTNLSLEKGMFTVAAPADLTVNYRMDNGPVIQTSQKGNTKSYQWTISDFKAIKAEQLMPDAHEFLPYVLLASGRFEIESYTGSMNSWDDFGLFMNKMYAGRNVLPEPLKQKVKEITTGQSEIEKIKTLYQYLQDNTRYISIQLGIGGWQPLDANFVYAKKYGDCKALTNFMNAMLAEVGIKGYNALIYANEDKNKFYEDFPSNQFNHVISCVPVAKDTIWLECTSQSAPFNYLGNFTDDREALLITDNGAKVVRTPAYKKEQNLQLRNVVAKIDADGNLKADVTTNYTGLQQDDVSWFFHNTSNEDQLKKLKRAFNIPTYDILAVAYKQDNKSVPVMQEKFELTSLNYASVSGKRIFLSPLILSATRNKLDAEAERKFDIVYDYPFIDKDTIIIEIPEGYKPEAIPKSVKVDNKFGLYTLEYTVKNNKIQVSRTYSRNQGRFPKTDYKDYAAFYNLMHKVDNSRLVFVKNEQ